MNTIAVRTSVLGQLRPALARLLDAPPEEVGCFGPPEKEAMRANGGFSVVDVSTAGRLGSEVEDDKRLATGLSKLIDSPVYVEAGEEEDFLAEYIDGECVRLVRYDEDDEENDMSIDL